MERLSSRQGTRGSRIDRGSVHSRTICIEPEESVKKRAAEAIDKALEAQDPATVVKVVASGHMTFKDYTAKTGASNYCSVLIEPIGGFVE